MSFLLNESTQSLKHRSTSELYMRRLVWRISLFWISSCYSERSRRRSRSRGSSLLGRRLAIVKKKKKKKTNLSHLSRTCIASMRSISSACWAGGRSGGACIFGLKRRGKERALLASACFAQLADWKRARESVFFFFPPLARLLARSRAGTTTKEKKLSSPLSSTSSSCIPSPSSHHGLFCGSPRSPWPGRFDARNR